MPAADQLQGRDGHAEPSHFGVAGSASVMRPARVMGSHSVMVPTSVKGPTSGTESASVTGSARVTKSGSAHTPVHRMLETPFFGQICTTFASINIPLGA
ncbi:hypothetical protein FKM82_023186 [Ascaphus truei]